MKIKQLKRQQPRAWEARKRTAYARRSLRAIAKLTAKAIIPRGRGPATFMWGVKADAGIRRNA